MTAMGLNIWFELATTDVAAAVRFYTSVIGGQLFEQTGQTTLHYVPFAMGDDAVSAAFLLPDDAKKKGFSPHWLSYTVVEDVDKTTARAVELGGSIIIAPRKVPDVGRVAILADPQGVDFAICTPEVDVTPTEDKPGHFCWSELNTTDYEAAWKFYSDLFGWKKRGETEMGPMGTYFMFQDPTERTKGGMSNLAKHRNVPPHWLHYITVSDMDQTVERIKQKGGKILNGPMPLPDGDIIAQCVDPQGAMFAIYAHGRKAP